MNKFVLVLEQNSNLSGAFQRPYSFQIALPIGMPKPASLDELFVISRTQNGSTPYWWLRGCTVIEIDGRVTIIGDASKSMALCSPSDPVPETDFLVTAEDQNSEILFFKLKDGESELLASKFYSSIQYGFGSIPLEIQNVALRAINQSVANFEIAVEKSSVALRTNFEIRELRVASDYESGDPYFHVSRRLVTILLSKGLVDIDPGRNLWPDVDLGLTSATGANLKARLFGKFNVTNRAMMREKTQRAEDVHQEIVSDCALELERRGLSPKITNSFDLALLQQGGLLIFEIKSATAENIFSQFEAGLSQLQRYRWEALSHHRPIACKLILELPPSYEVEDLNALIEFGEHLLVEVNFWDRRKLWPERCPSLDSSSLPGFESQNMLLELAERRLRDS